MNIDMTQFGGLVAALMTVGAVLKHAIPQFPTRFIPLATLVLGLLGYLALTDGWSMPAKWVEAIIASATATGLHSGIKNVFQEITTP